ncbi:MAG TPA: helix-turn-helix domain-containing protein [Puia sp.]|nr:helix-turn-helix domain-containing protein [Puia sp.]
MSKNSISILMNYEKEAFWAQMRKIIQEEFAKLSLKAEPATSTLEVPGMTYKPLYNSGEICQLFGITKPTIYEWIKNGVLKPVKIQSRVYFLHQDVQQLIQSGTIEK